MNEAASGNPRTTNVGLPPTVATMCAADEDALCDSGDICDGEESDDDDDLQALLYLAQLPYCRLTKTFVRPLPTAALPTSTYKTTNNPVLALVPTKFNDDPSAACISPFPAAAAAHDADALDDKPPEIDPDDAAMSDDDDDYACSSDDDVEFDTEPTSWEEEEKDIAPPAPPRPALVAAPAARAARAATAATAAAAPTPATAAIAPTAPTAETAATAAPALKIRAREVVVGENRAFIEATFVPADDDRRGCSTCTTCGKRVAYGRNKVATLLRHAVTNFCLLRRVELQKRDAQRDGSAAAAAAAAASPSPIRLVNPMSHDPGAKGAVRNVWENQFLPPVGNGNDADSAASAGLPWTCRHCTVPIHGMNDQLRFFQHVALCVGIVPLLHNLSSIMQHIEPAPPQEPGPTSVGARSDIVRENREFVVANFVPAELHESSACKICGKQVLHAHQRASQLLRHALTSSCLLRRVANDAAAEEGSMPRGSPHSAWGKLARSRTLPKDAFRGVWVSHFRSLDGNSPLDASAAFGRWRCRHCSAAILVSRHNLLFFQHLSSCIGIVPLMRSLKAILQQLVLSGLSSNNDGKQRMSDEAIAGRLSSSFPFQGSGEQRDNGTEAGDFSAMSDLDVESVPAEPPRPGGAHGDPLTAGGARDDPEQYQCDSKNHGVVALNISTLHGASTGPGPIKPLPSCRTRDDREKNQLGSTSGGVVTPQVTGLSQTGPGVGGPRAAAGRTRAEIKQENRLFLSSNFSCSAKAIACRICDKHIFQGENCYLLRHAVSLPCLAWRVERERERRPVASEGATGSGFLPRLCIDVNGTAVTSALRSYREGHFGRLAGVPPPQDVWACRHCGSKVSRTDALHPFLYHLAVCVGAESVIRDLEDILRRVGGTVEPC
jgi:hypothetical protein